ncbi:MAG: valine--tRNA ligase [Candidatus Levybacteria bacterium]|nr:valine--tRNA ligase [Candidatus Levybacteria bacterium]
MDKAYNHKHAEEKWYDFWEKSGFFKPEVNPLGKPYTIVLPPPNASGKMHIGNVLMIAIEDILIRWHRMKGYSALWIPGSDHAGAETQITFERELKKQGKSRFSYNRTELYQAIWGFVQENKNVIKKQIRQMGASVDWDRYAFTLDDKAISIVHNTFRKLAKDNLIYRGDYMVNYCTKCGTTYSDVELRHEERKDPLYYLKYGPFVLATVRPETKFGDTAIAVNPGDKRYKDWIGKEVEVEDLNGKFNLRVIADNFVDPLFGTGVVKVTPAHDKNDYDASLRHNLEIKPVIDMDGKLNEKAGKYQGLSVFEGRKRVVADLRDGNLLEKIDENYVHNVTLCKAGHDIEPMVLPNWFIKVDDKKKSLKKPAFDVVKKGLVKIYPKWREITYTRWIDEMHDWPISRQNVWGIQIPVWYEVVDPNKFYIWFIDKNNEYRHGNLGKLLDQDFKIDEIISGLQRVLAMANVSWVFADDKDDGKIYFPETDTFDTWFSSGQWPIATLGYPESSDFKKFYPTSVLETGWEILRLWVSRMVMLGIYITGKPPFHSVYLHGIVRALDGRKMSKSLGNVINPDEYIDQYGVDALRMGLIAGTANGKDFTFPKDRVIAYKHFANKIWNMGRFILVMINEYNVEIISLNSIDSKKFTKEDKAILKDVRKVVGKVDISLGKYRFADAGEEIYQFMWHTIADKYIEQVKNRDDKQIALTVLLHVYKTCLKLLHPFMPYVTEELYQYMPKEASEPNSIMIANWPIYEKSTSFNAK